MASFARGWIYQEPVISEWTVISFIFTKNKKKGCKAYFISPYDPRLPHPREIISKNYELLARNEKAKALFPRENLVAASRRLKT